MFSIRTKPPLGGIALAGLDSHIPSVTDSFCDTCVRHQLLWQWPRNGATGCIYECLSSPLLHRGWIWSWWGHTTTIRVASQCRIFSHPVGGVGGSGRGKGFARATFSLLRHARPYKINDFKPLSAYLFPELVPQHQYDWWGCVDNDMILGNVSHFFPTSLLDQYDIISPLYNYSSFGPFMLYRNHRIVNELFFQSDMHLGYLFANPKPVCFDEWGQCGLKRWGAHMSGIINERAVKLGLRPHSIALPQPFIWDGLCKDDEKLPPSHCARCVYRNSTLFATLPVERPNENVKHDELALFCHYYLSKAKLETSLKDGALLEQLLQAKEFAVDFSIGFSSPWVPI